MTDSTDRCQFCLGCKGGVLGQEIAIGGALLCIECHDLFQALVRNTREIQADDSDAGEVGRLVQETTLKAAEHARMEAAGELVSMVTPFGGTVTDPDELLLCKQLQDINMSRCPHCANTGWRHNDSGSSLCCPCPYGLFLAKKTGRPVSF